MMTHRTPYKSTASTVRKPVLDMRRTIEYAIANSTYDINGTTVWVGKDRVEQTPDKCYVFDAADHQIHEHDCNLTAAALCRSTGEAPSPYGFKGSSAACAAAGYGMPYVHDKAENDARRGKKHWPGTVPGFTGGFGPCRRHKHAHSDKLMSRRKRRHDQV